MGSAVTDIYMLQFSIGMSGANCTDTSTGTAGCILMKQYKKKKAVSEGSLI